jgi:hypothetical protein
MANIDDLVTVQKNGVVAINALTATLEAFRAIYQSFVGDKTFLGASESSLVATGAGRLVNLVVSVTGATAGSVHDSATVQGATAANVIAVIPATPGITQINVPYSDGLVLLPGAGQTVSITYS